MHGWATIRRRCRRGRRAPAGVCGEVTSTCVRGKCWCPKAPWRRPGRCAVFRAMRSPIHDSTPLHSLIAGIRDARFSRGVRCPRCGHSRVHRWGSFSCRQRYRCLGCSRTFSDLTATPAAYTKKLDRWPTYGQCIHAAVPVRAAAAFVGIHPSTAFRWRHAILDSMRAQDTETVGGWTELATMWFAYSEKGRRNVSRNGGVRSPADSARPTVHVVVACDRSARVTSAITAVSGARMFDGGELLPAFVDRVETGVTIAARQRPVGPASRLARAVDGTFHATGARIRTVDTLLVHVSNALAYRKRFRDWHKRFRGVATRYLSNYLVWHRLLDRTYRCDLSISALRWPIQESGNGAFFDDSPRLKATFASQQLPRTLPEVARQHHRPSAQARIDMTPPPRPPPN